MSKNMDVWIHILSVCFVLGFSLLCSGMMIFKCENFAIRVLCIIVLMSATFLTLNRNTYLPFLGITALPPTLFEKEMVPVGSTQTYILQLKDVEDGTRVIYWGSKPNESKNRSPKEAYDDYSNTGISIVRDKKAILKFNCPEEYNVWIEFMPKIVDKHIHYRLVYKNDPIISPVFTEYVKCQ